MGLQISDAKRTPTADDLRNAERMIGRPLPEEYKRFLMEHNGGRPEPAEFKITWRGQDWADDWQTGMVHYFLALHDGELSNFFKYFRTYQGRIPEDTVPIAYDPGGNLVLLGVGDTNMGRVFFWVQDFEVEEGKIADYGNVGLVANRFNEFLDGLF